MILEPGWGTVCVCVSVCVGTDSTCSCWLMRLSAGPVVLRMHGFCYAPGTGCGTTRLWRISFRAKSTLELWYLLYSVVETLTSRAWHQRQQPRQHAAPARNNGMAATLFPFLSFLPWKRWGEVGMEADLDDLAAVLRQQHGVADGQGHRDEPAVFVPRARANSHDFALVLLALVLQTFTQPLAARSRSDGRVPRTGASWAGASWAGQLARGGGWNRGITCSGMMMPPALTSLAAARVMSTRLRRGRSRAMLAILGRWRLSSSNGKGEEVARRLRCSPCKRWPSSERRICQTVCTCTAVYSAVASNSMSKVMSSVEMHVEMHVEMKMHVENLDSRRMKSDSNITGSSRG